MAILAFGVHQMEIEYSFNDNRRNIMNNKAEV